MTHEKYCPNGHLMDPSWNVCPYCRGEIERGQPSAGDSLQKTVRESAPGVAEAPPAAPPPRKTLRMEEQRSPVVGWLVDLDGAQKGEDFRIREGRVVLGAGAGCDIALRNDFASEQHASLRVQDGEYVLTDLDSKNGTQVNGEPIARCTLADGDHISIGETTYVFKGLYPGGGER